MLLIVFAICVAVIIGLDRVSSNLAFNAKSSSCEKRGGVLVHHPLSSVHDGRSSICNFEYKDGGKACKSNADCMGDCIKVPDIVEHGRCSPATLYGGLGVHYVSTEGSYDTCPYDEVRGFCKLELFNKSDKWKDFHYVM